VPLRPVSELGLVDITEVPARGTRTATRSHSTPARSHPSQPLRSNSANDPQVEAEGDRPQGRRASTQRKPDAGLQAAKSRAASTSKRGSTPPATAEDSGGKSNRARSSNATKPGTTSERRSARRPRNAPPTRADQTKGADAQARPSSKPRGPSASTTNSERSRSRSAAATDTGSGGATRRATTRTPKRPNDSASRTRGATAARRQTTAASRGKRNAASWDGHRSRNGQRPDQTKPSSAAKVGIYALAGASLVAGGLLFARAALRR
jgi:hypothetical protein